jgi:tyrosinase
LPWHRAYLLRFEQALRDTGHDVMLPWWDWTKTRSIPAAYLEAQAPDGSPNPLHSAAQGEKSPEPETRQLAGSAQTVRSPARPRTQLPTAAEINGVLKYTQYEQFRGELEDYHGEVHIWVGGHMANLPFASFDPIFWAHHCMIDRLWRIWQLHHPGASFPESLRAKTMTPFNLTGAAVLDPTALGYDYSVSIAQVRP